MRFFQLQALLARSKRSVGLDGHWKAGSVDFWVDMHLAVRSYAFFAAMVLIDVCTVHVSTALALIIPVTTTSASLSPKAFLAVWLLSSLITTPIAGRYRYAAIIFAGISGG